MISSNNGSSIKVKIYDNTIFVRIERDKHYRSKQVLVKESSPQLC